MSKIQEYIEGLKQKCREQDEQYKETLKECEETNRRTELMLEAAIRLWLIAVVGIVVWSIFFR